MNENEFEAMNKSRKAFEKTVVGTKIVSMETRNVDDAKITLDDGTVVMLRSEGSCCAWGGVNTVSELLNTDHAITRVETTKDGETWHIYADDMTIGSIGVTSNEGTGMYGFGISIDVRRNTHEFTRVYEADKF